MVFYSIAGFTPIWFNNRSDVMFQRLSCLAPKKEWWKEWHTKFEKDLNSDESKQWYKEKYYETVLSKLNAKDLIDSLKIAEGFDICLVCYETPNKFCHRQIVSDWLNKNEIECKEYL